MENNDKTFKSLLTPIFVAFVMVNLAIDGVDTFHHSSELWKCAKQIYDIN